VPLLGDFLGTLLAELVVGRAQADAQALAVAKQLYRGDEFLRTFPVPRFRLPTVTIRVPVAVRGPGADVAGSGAIGAPYTPIQVREATLRALAVELRRANLSLPVQARDAVRGSVDRTVTGLIGRREPPGLHETAVAMADAVRSALGSEAALVESELTFAILSQLVQAKLSSPRLDVAVTAAELKEATHTMSLDLTVREEAVEWTAIETDGKTHDRLVPE
jgi:hypothetical protein